MTNIEHRQNEKNGVFVALSGDDEVGEMTYSMESPKVMAIEHTEVKSSERGNNIGNELLDAATAYASANDMRIRPVCKFVNIMFRKNPEKYEAITLK